MIRITEGKTVWGESAAGVLFVCTKTKRILLLLRSEYVLEPNTWGIISGKIDGNESPKAAAIRESEEEVGYKAENLIESYVYKHGDFTFYNFVCYVDKEFTPKLNWENENYKWFDINELPDNLHYGLEDYFSKIKPDEIVKGNMSRISINKKGGKITAFDSPVDDLNKLDIDDSFFGIAEDLSSSIPFFADGGSIDAFTKEKIKRAYVSIRIKYETTSIKDYSKPYFSLYEIESFDDKPFQELSNQVLEGIRGVSTSKFNVGQWLTHRDCLILMPFEEFLELNDTEQILYYDADYLTRNGLDIMYRIYDHKQKGDSDYSAIINKIFPKIQQEFEIEYKALTGNKETLYAICVNIFNIYNSSKFQRYFAEQPRVNSVRDFVDIILKYNKSGQFKTDYYYNRDFPEQIDEKELENIVRKGIERAGAIYGDESEWIIKNQTLVIPNNTQLFFVNKNFHNYEEKINEYVKKYNLHKNYKIHFVNQKDIDRFRQNLDAKTEKRYKEEFQKQKSEVDKKIAQALIDVNNQLFLKINRQFEYEIKDRITLPLQDYQDTSIIYNEVYDAPEINQIAEDFAKLYLELFTKYADSIIKNKSRYAFTNCFEEFVSKVRIISDEFSDSEEPLFYDGNGYKIYKSSLLSQYWYAIKNIDIYDFSKKIKEFIGSDLYRYYSKDEISFNKGGEMQSLNLSFVSGLTPANIIHAKELGGIDRTKLKIVSKGLEDKYFNKGDIILIISNETKLDNGSLIPLSKFIVAYVPENTSPHIINILTNNDVIVLNYTDVQNLKTKVQRMEYLYFIKGGDIPEKAKGGDCYKVAANLLIENNYTKKIAFIGTPYLVHAEVTGQGEIEGIKYGHAWVEDDVFVYDYSNGRNLMIPKQLYYRVGEIKMAKGKYHKYTREQARKKMLKSGHYGCWDLDTKYEGGGALLVGGLATDMTDEQVANKYNISMEKYNEKLKEGMEVEKEHTKNPDAQKLIAKDHLFEDIDYYKKLKRIEELGNIVALPDCYVNLDRLQQVLQFQGYKIVKIDEQQYSDGGIVVGKRHSESDENGTGERFIVESTGQLVELEGGEIVINAESMSSDKKYDFEGKKMTGREIASELNHRYGGVKFNEGGKVSCGCDKYYYGGELPSATLDSLSGGEGVINFKTSQSNNKYEFQGKKMTPREILSKINYENGGKKF